MLEKSNVQLQKVTKFFHLPYIEKWYPFSNYS